MATSESSKSAGATGSDGLSALWDAVRRGFESMLPVTGLMDRVEAAVEDLGERFETRVRENRDRLLGWTGVLDKQDLASLGSRLEALETRLAELETLLDHLDNHREDPRWNHGRPS